MRGEYKRAPANGVKRRYGDRRQVNILIDEETLADVKRFAEAGRYLSLSEALRHLIEWGLESHKGAAR